MVAFIQYPCGPWVGALASVCFLQARGWVGVLCCVCVCVRAHVHVCVCVYARVCTHAMSVAVCACACVRACVYVGTCVLVCMCVCVRYECGGCGLSLGLPPSLMASHTTTPATTMLLRGCCLPSPAPHVSRGPGHAQRRVLHLESIPGPSVDVPA